MTEILDESAVNEIEDRAAKASSGPWMVTDGQHIDQYAPHPEGNRLLSEGSYDANYHMFGEDDVQFIAHAREDIPALCATVKHLRDEAKSKKIELLQLSGRGELLTKVHVQFDNLDEVAAVRNEFDRLRNTVIVGLESQLKQTRAENERLALQLKDWQEEKDTNAGYL